MKIKLEIEPKQISNLLIMAEKADPLGLILNMDTRDYMQRQAIEQINNNKGES